MRSTPRPAAPPPTPAFAPAGSTVVRAEVFVQPVPRATESQVRRPRLVDALGIVFAAGAAAFAISAVLEFGIGTTFAALDLDSYLGAAERLTRGESLYPPSGTLTVGPRSHFMYSPPVALAFVPLAALPHQLAVVLWGVSLLTVAAGVCVALIRPLPPAARPWAAGAAMLFFPLGSDLTSGNVNAILLGLALLSWRLRGHPVAAGGLLGFALILKPLLALLLVFFMLSGRWRVAASALLVAACIVGATAPWLAQYWVPYAELLIRAAGQPEIAGFNVLPDALRAPLWRTAIAAAALAGTALAARAARRTPHAEPLAFALALALCPLAGSYVWFTFLVLALPLVLLLAFSAAPVTPLRGAALLAWLLLIGAPHVGGGFVNSDLPFAGLALLAVVGLIRLHTASTPSASAVATSTSGAPR